MILRLLLFGYRACSLNTNIGLEKENLLILGFGRVGKTVAEAAMTATSSSCPLIGLIVGTKRKMIMTPDTIESVCNKVRQIQFDSDELPSVARQCRYLLVTIPVADDMGSIDERFQNVVRELPSNSWIGIISTTGVYGDHKGAWVTEDSECKCVDQRYAQYESKWISWANDCRQTLNIFRCAGIYSDDQSALHTVYRNGYEPKAGDRNRVDNIDTKSKTNRIHVVDIGQSVTAAMRIHHNQRNLFNKNQEQLPARYRIFNLADNLPEYRSVVFDYAAKLLIDKGISVSQVKQRSKIEMGKGVIDSKRDNRRGTDRKLISNKRMLQELLPDKGLRFPSYQEGLVSILNNENNQWWKT